MGIAAWYNNYITEIKTILLVSNFSGKYFVDIFCLEVKNIVNYIQISIWLYFLKGVVTLMEGHLL